MKNLNIKIVLLALALLLAAGQSMANESGLFLTNSSVDKFSHLAKADDFKKRGKGNNQHDTKKQDDDQHGNKKNQCGLDGGGTGRSCETGECVVSKKDCPKKEKSPHGRDHHDS